MYFEPSETLLAEWFSLGKQQQGTRKVTAKVVKVGWNGIDTASKIGIDWKPEHTVAKLKTQSI